MARPGRGGGHAGAWCTAIIIATCIIMILPVSGGAAPDSSQPNV